MASVSDMNQYRSEDLGDGYVVHFYLPPGQQMLVQVTFSGTFVAEKRTSSHVAAARWARRQIGSHKKSRKILKGER